MRWDLVRFDLTRGLPAAMGVLRKSLGARERVRVLARFAWRSIATNPFAGLGPAASAAEAFTRHQFRPVLLFDAVLREDLGLQPEVVRAILEDVVAETGAAFIEATVAQPTAEDWRKWSGVERARFAEEVIGKFENAEGEIAELTPERFGVDITRCHFAEIARRLGRSDLAPLFCRADAVYYGRPESGIRLDRDETIATGAERCPFRFRFEPKP